MGFCQWAVDEGHLRRNPARAMERPTVVAIAPTELSEQQRFVLKTMVEQHATSRFAAIQPVAEALMLVRDLGRKSNVSKDPKLSENLERLVEPVTRGDPQSPLRWMSKSVIVR